MSPFVLPLGFHFEKKPQTGIFDKKNLWLTLFGFWSFWILKSDLWPTHLLVQEAFTKLIAIAMFLLSTIAVVISDASMTVYSNIQPIWKLSSSLCRRIAAEKTPYATADLRKIHIPSSQNWESYQKSASWDHPKWVKSNEQKEERRERNRQC